MTKDDSDMTRRTALKGIGVTGAAALTGGAGLLATSGSAAAASASIETNPVSAKSPNGDIEKVFLSPQGSIDWENFDEAVESIRVKIESRVTNKDGGALTGWTTAFDRTFGLGDHGGLEGDFNGASLGEVVLYDNGDEGGDTTHFDVSQDGASVRRRVELRVTVRLLHGDSLADPRDEAEIVEKAAFYADSTNEAASSGVTAQTNGEMK